MSVTLNCHFDLTMVLFKPAKETNKEPSDRAKINGLIRADGACQRSFLTRVTPLQRRTSSGSGLNPGFPMATHHVDVLFT